jgi:DNA-binding NarL/FixJ family response regulator
MHHGIDSTSAMSVPKMPVSRPWRNQGYPEPMPSSYRVLVADDQLLVRVGILAVLREIGGYDCLPPVEDGARCIARCEFDPPDLLLLDINMPGANGLEVTQAVLARHPQVRIVVLTSHASAELAGQAMEAGARGFVSKDFVMDELALALRMVMAGRPYMSPDIALQAVAPQVAQTTAGQHCAGRQPRSGEAAASCADATPVRCAALHLAGTVQQGDRPRAGPEPQDRGIPPRRTHPAAGPA